MNIRDNLLSANDAGTLLETLVATRYDDVESVANTVSSLHNDREIDFLAALDSCQLDSVSDQSFSALRRVFYQTLPQLDCSVDAVVAAYERMYEKAGHDGTAGLVYDSLTKWFRQSPVRIEEGLALIRRDKGVNSRLVRPVLWRVHLTTPQCHLKRRSIYRTMHRYTFDWTPSGCLGASYR